MTRLFCCTALRIGVAAAALCTAASRPAAASAVNCSDPSFQAACSAIWFGNGGLNPWVDVSGKAGRFMDIANPKEIGYSYDDALAFESGIGSLSTGVLKSTAWAKDTYADFDSFKIEANDVFTIAGAPGPVEITARFRVDGVANLPAVNSSILIDGGQVSLVLCGPGGSFACGGDWFNRTGSPPFPGYTGPTYSFYNPSQNYLERDYTFTVPTGVPFNVYYSMQIDVYSGSLIDLTDPGSLSFDIPPDFTLSSLGGFTAGVPEPGTAALLGLGFVALGAAIRRRRLQQGE